MEYSLNGFMMYKSGRNSWIVFDELDNMKVLAYNLTFQEAAEMIHDLATGQLVLTGIEDNSPI